MALKCPTCGSTSTQVNLDRYQCIDCGAEAHFDGTVAESGPNADTRKVLERSLAPRETNIVGNLADLQRLGGQQAPKSGGIADAFPLPPGVTQEQAEASAEGYESDESTTSTSAARASTGTQTKAKAK